ncbi:MAG: hypothetical protein HOP08_12300 [Cyclobacteriaceae bacterium]|nr:hypothetical protein [Cyclobacteriaceae bacterium]
MENNVELALLANTIFAFAVIGAVTRPHLARSFFSLIFLGSAVFNLHNLSDLATLSSTQEMSVLPLFKNHVIGFSQHLIASVVRSLAALQLLIGIGLILPRRWATAAMILAAAYGIFITTLGGYEFPAALVMSIAFLILAGNYKHEGLWRPNQYSEKLSYHSHQGITG